MTDLASPRPLRDDAHLRPTPAVAAPGRWHVALGWTAIVGSIAYFVSDVLEATHGGFSDRQLWLTLVAEAAIPFIVIGLYLAQRPAIRALGRWSAFAYAYTFVYFTGTVAYALAKNTPDFDRLSRDLDPTMTLHGVAMVVAGIGFGYAVLKARVLPRWTSVAFATGVVLTALTVRLPSLVELSAVAIRDAGIAGMGTAVLRLERSRRWSSPH